MTDTVTLAAAGITPADVLAVARRGARVELASSLVRLGFLPSRAEPLRRWPDGGAPAGRTRRPWAVTPSTR